MVPASVQNVEQLLVLARQAGYRAGALSKMLRISPRQLRRHTHDRFGCSPQAWLDQQRLRLAPPLLKEHRCIKTVTFMLGFKCVSHFSRMFKLYYGLPPTAYVRWDDQQKEPGAAMADGPTMLNAKYFPRVQGDGAVEGGHYVN